MNPDLDEELVTCPECGDEYVYLAEGELSSTCDTCGAVVERD